MARTFVSSGNNQYLSSTGTFNPAASPLTVSIWFNPVSATADYDAVFIKNAGSTHYQGIYLNNPDGKVSAVSNAGGADALASSTTTFSANTWNHACAVFTNASSRAAFLNGGGKGTNVTSVTPTSLTHINVGGFFSGSLFGAMDGLLADVAIWDAALSDAEVLSLAKGFSPLQIRPNNNIFYAPIMGRFSPEPDLVGLPAGKFPLTLNGAPTFGAHPPQINYPQRPIIGTNQTPPRWGAPKIGAVVEVLGGNLVLTEPPGALQNDLLVAAISYRDTPSFTLPAGWSLVASQLSGGNIDTVAATSIGSGVMAYIVRGASAPDLTFVRTGGDVALGCILAYNSQAASPYDTGSANTISVAATNVTTPGLTTATDGELLVAAALITNNNAASAFTAATDPATPSGTTDVAGVRPIAGTWTERADSLTATGADAGLAMADAIKATAGATGTLSWTDVSTQRSSMIVGAFKLLGSPAGGTTTPQTITIGSTSSVSLLKSSGKTIPISVSDTLAVLRQTIKPIAVASPTGVSQPKSVSKSIAVTDTSTVLASKSVSKISSLTSTSSTIIQAFKTWIKSLTIGSTVSVSTIKVAGKRITITSTSSTALAKLINKLVGITATSSTVVSALKVLLKTITIGASSSVSVSKSIGKLGLISATGSISVLKAISRSLGLTSSSSISTNKLVGKTSTITATSSTVVNALKVFLKTISITANSSLSLLRNVGHIVAINSNSSVSVIKSAGRRLAIASSSTLSAIKSVGKFTSITSTSSVVSSALKVFLKTINITASSAISLRRAMSTTIGITATDVVSVIKTISKRLGISSFISLIVDKLIGGLPPGYAPASSERTLSSATEIRLLSSVVESRQLLSVTEDRRLSSTTENRRVDAEPENRVIDADDGSSVIGG